MLNRIWAFVMPTQAVLTDVDPDALWGTVDRPAMERLEVGAADPFVVVRSVLDHGGRIPARRDAVAVALHGTFRRTATGEHGRVMVRLEATVVVRWDAFFVPTPGAWVPRQEKTRRARCRELARPRRRPRAGGGRTGHDIAAWLRRHRRAARFVALACAGDAA